MSLSSITEFAQYRFVRDAEGGVIGLPSSGSEEKVLLVLDCARWGLARLHIFEGAARRTDKLESFQEDLRQIAGIRSDCLSRLISWGRDAEELFYADELRDGEPLPAYLTRTGGVPVAVAAKWVVDLYDLLASFESLPPSLERFATLNFEVARSRLGEVRLVFSEYSGWAKPGAQVREHRLEWHFAQIFCSLMAGVPVRTFHRDSLPRNFEVLDEAAREVIVDTLEEEGDGAATGFRETMGRISGGAEDHANDVSTPQMPVREWLRRDLAGSYDGVPDYELEKDFDRSGEAYAVPSHLRGAAVHIQLIPGPDSIPREGWLAQHHDATRRPGRGKVSQLSVNYLEDRNSITLVGEEQVEGIDLETYLAESGPLPVESVGLLSAAIHAALEGLERQTGSSAVWWLPPENIFLVTGTRSRSGSVGYLSRNEPEIWSRVPLKFRLHQTLESLKRGVNAPSKLREMFRLPGKQFEEVRRSAISVPLLWFLLTGSRFRWSRPVEEHPEVPGPLAELFERFRHALRENPHEVEGDFFLRFEEEIAREPVEAEEKPQDEDREDPLEKILQSTLHEGEVGEVFAPVAEPTQEAAVEFELAMERLSEKKKGTLPWLWISLAGVVAASVVGFLLTGWHFRLGPFRTSAAPEFAVPEVQVVKTDPATKAKTELENFLVSSGTPESLRLLPLLERFDSGTYREVFQRHLGIAAGGGDAVAYRILGLLALAEEGSSDVVAGYFHEGAKRGDTESQYQYALARWLQGGRAAIDPEALRFLELSAGVGHVEALELKALVKQSEGDGEGARRWMELSARKGNSSAEYQLGFYYSTGVGGEIDKEKAASYFRSAAEKGDERAMYYYGRCLSEGFGVPASFPEAQRWMRAASALGHGGALRWCLDRGIEPN